MYWRMKCRRVNIYLREAPERKNRENREEKINNKIIGLV